MSGRGNGSGFRYFVTRENRPLSKNNIEIYYYNRLYTLDHRQA